MQTLRNAKHIATLVLVWFALFLGSAVASTLIQPGNLQMVCSAGGAVKWLDINGEEGQTQASASMDCPLCASVSAPPATQTVQFEPPSSLAHALQALAQAHIASATAAPPPSRGPPASSL